jgi:hypothetical protein
MEESPNNNIEPLKNGEFSERELRALKIRLFLYAIERRAKRFFQGIKNRFYCA